MIRKKAKTAAYIAVAAFLAILMSMPGSAAGTDAADGGTERTAIAEIAVRHARPAAIAAAAETEPDAGNGEGGTVPDAEKDSEGGEVPYHGTLNAEDGINYGPSGLETWYDLDMDGVLYLMDWRGYSYEDYPYWIREDGVKMFGEYVMAAANLEYRPFGSVWETSLGTAMVVDTGDLLPYQLDIAVAWETEGYA